MLTCASITTDQLDGNSQTASCVPQTLQIRDHRCSHILPPSADETTERSRGTDELRDATVCLPQRLLILLLLPLEGPLTCLRVIQLRNADRRAIISVIHPARS